MKCSSYTWRSHSFPLLCFLLLMISFSLSAQKTPALVKFSNPGSVHTTNGYSQAVMVDLGNCNMVIISGQVPLDVQGNLIGKNDFNKQTEQVFTNIETILKSCGGNINHLVKTGVFITDISNLSAFRTIRNTRVNKANPPASTLVEVKNLYREDIMIEIEATAIIPKR